MPNAYVGGIAAFRYCGASGGDTAALRLLRRGDASRRCNLQRRHGNASLYAHRHCRDSARLQRRRTRRGSFRRSAVPGNPTASRQPHHRRSHSAHIPRAARAARRAMLRTIREFPRRTRRSGRIRRSGRLAASSRSRADAFMTLDSRNYFLSVRRTKISSSPACTASSPTIGYDASASARNTGFLTSSP